MSCRNWHSFLYLKRRILNKLQEENIHTRASLNLGLVNFFHPLNAHTSFFFHQTVFDTIMSTLMKLKQSVETHFTKANGYSTNAMVKYYDSDSMFIEFEHGNTAIDDRENKRIDLQMQHITCLVKKNEIIDTAQNETFD